MRSVHEPIVGSIKHHGVLFDSRVRQRFSDHPDCHVDGVDLLIVLCHHTVIVIRVVPAVEAFVLTTLATLQRKMLSGLSAVVVWLGELDAFVNVLINRVRLNGMVGSFETDRQTKRFIFFCGIVNKVTTERTIRTR